MSLSLYSIIFIISASLLLPESVAVEKCTVSIDKNSVVTSNRNIKKDGNNYTINVRIEPGNSYKDTCLGFNGTGIPNFKVISTKKCGTPKPKLETTLKSPKEIPSTNKPTVPSQTKSNGIPTQPTQKINTPTPSSLNNTNNQPRPTQNNNNINLPKPLRHQGELPFESVINYFTGIDKIGGDNMVITQLYTKNETGIKMYNQSGVFDEVMNKPMNNGILTFYTTGDGGACGIDNSDPIMSAAASTLLYDSRAPWLESSLPGKPYVNTDRICVNKCVKIEYKGKSLTVPINNSCPGCPKNHVDLSIPAWMWLEPNYKIGRLFNATLTFMTCPGMQ
uniref:RlpA-like protein double-psi beta-barrel domain-containing protein n=1 Tax=Meloidogyne javanica TaxID=6303 RepID=A0A915MQP5_MELJA